MGITRQLRDAIDGSGVSLYRIAKDSGISYSALHRFARGEQLVTLDGAEKLATYFEMKLTRPRRVKRSLPR